MPHAVRTELATVGGVEQVAGDSGGLTILPAPIWEDGIDSHLTDPAEVTFGKQTFQDGHCLDQRSHAQQRIPSGTSRKKHRFPRPNSGGAARWPPLKL